MLIPKFQYVRSKRARDSARDESCTMNSPECNYDKATTVLCHSNESEHGKGKGIKASDIYTFYGCSGCNSWYDNSPAPKSVKLALFWPAWEKTQKRFREKGLMEVVVE